MERRVFEVLLGWSVIQGQRKALRVGARAGERRDGHDSGLWTYPCNPSSFYPCGDQTILLLGFVIYDMPLWPGHSGRRLGYKHLAPGTMMTVPSGCRLSHVSRGDWLSDSLDTAHSCIMACRPAYCYPDTRPPIRLPETCSSTCCVDFGPPGYLTGHPT